MAPLLLKAEYQLAELELRRDQFATSRGRASAPSLLLVHYSAPLFCEHHSFLKFTEDIGIFKM